MTQSNQHPRPTRDERSAQAEREQVDLGGPSAPVRALPRTGFLLLALLTLLWGFNWPMMKIVLTEVTPWTFRLACLVLGGVGFSILNKAGGLSLKVPGKEIKPLLVVAFFNITCWMMFSAFGLMLMPAGRASIIAFTMPVWATIISSFVLRERLTVGTIIGLALGISGLAVLIGPDLAVFGSAPLGAIFMICSAVTWGAGTTLMKYYSWTIPVAVLTSWQLVIGSVPVVIGALVMESPAVLFHLSWRALLALAYGILLAIILCYWLWFKIVSLFPASIASIGTLMIPIVGVFSSAMVLGDPLGAREITALVLVVSALAMVLLRPAMSRERAKGIRR